MDTIHTQTGRDSQPPLDRSAEVELVERARNGDPDAVAGLYREHVDVVYRYVYARTRDRTLAEDITAQVFLRAIQNLPRYETTGAPFIAWLYRIACARVADHWRAHHRRQEVSLEAMEPADLAHPGLTLEAEQDWITAIDLLSELTEEQQEVLMLRFVGEMALVDIADTLGKSLGAVKAIQHRALATLARRSKNRET